MSSAAGLKSNIKHHWAHATQYYENGESEGWLKPFWGEGAFRARANALNHARIIDLACGHGRHSAQILENYDVERLWAVDVNESNIEFCRSRFKEDPRVNLIVNNGRDLAEMLDNSATALISYDAMVHFEYDDVISYIGEFFRVLESKGLALVHHSNNDREPGELWDRARGGRNFMSASLFRHVALRSGFRVVDQTIIDWGGAPLLDCLTLLQKP